MVSSFVPVGVGDQQERVGDVVGAIAQAQNEIPIGALARQHPDASAVSGFGGQAGVELGQCQAVRVDADIDGQGNRVGVARQQHRRGERY